MNLWFRIAVLAADSAAKAGAQSNGSGSMSSVWIMWGVIAVLAVVIDIFYYKPVSSWYSVGAIAALVSSFFGAGLLLQGLIFAVFSLTALLLVSYYINKKAAEKLESDVIPKDIRNKLKLEYVLLGKEDDKSERNKFVEGVVIKTIDPRKRENGLVKVFGIILPAKSVRNQEIEAGTRVVIKAIQKSKLGGFAQFIGGTNSSRYILIVMPKQGWERGKRRMVQEGEL